MWLQHKSKTYLFDLIVCFCSAFDISLEFEAFDKLHSFWAFHAVKLFDWPQIAFCTYGNNLIQDVLLHNFLFYQQWRYFASNIRKYCLFLFSWKIKVLVKLILYPGYTLCGYTLQLRKMAFESRKDKRLSSAK